MKIRNFLNLSLVVSSLFLGGCARYDVQPLHKLLSVSTNQDEGVVSFSYKIFDRNDCKRFLDRNVLAAGYQPIQITIVNNSDSSVEFSKTRFSLPYVSAEEIAHKVHTSTLARASSYGVGALFLWPLAIPAVVDGVMSSEANSKLDGDFARKELQDQIINPHSSIDGLIFVSSGSIVSEFSFTLIDAISKERIELSTSNPNGHKPPMKKSTILIIGSLLFAILFVLFGFKFAPRLGLGDLKKRLVAVFS